MEVSDAEPSPGIDLAQAQQQRQQQPKQGSTARPASRVQGAFGSWSPRIGLEAAAGERPWSPVQPLKPVAIPAAIGIVASAGPPPAAEPEDPREEAGAAARVPTGSHRRRSRALAAPAATTGMAAGRSRLHQMSTSDLLRLEGGQDEGALQGTCLGTYPLVSRRAVWEDKRRMDICSLPLVPQSRSPARRPTPSPARLSRPPQLPCRPPLPPPHCHVSPTRPRRGRAGR